MDFGSTDASDVSIQLSTPEIIIKKKKGLTLEKNEIEYFVKGVVDGTVQDAQLGAMLMAICLQHLDNDETTSLTRAMTHSGDVLTWPKEWKGSIVDKHSTGGVGDKISLLLAPALAACGVKVPMVSGRGLGHTGGTLDKLESIPGFKVSLSHAEMTKVLEEVGCCIVGQTSNLVPADKHMYATRDVTGTVENIGLIAASIISKKAAEELDVLVLDVKTGRGAFMENEKDARELAERMVNAGNGLGVKTVALLTNMDWPIGNMVGNALEVVESIEGLQGRGPEDLTDLVVRLGGQALFKCGKAAGMKEACQMVSNTLHNGTALAKFCAMMKAQGVDRDTADKLCADGTDLWAVLPKAKYTTELRSPKEGCVHDIDAMKCAVVCQKLGAGRSKAGDPVNFGVGIQLTAHVGQKIQKEDIWVRVYHDTTDVPPECKKMLEDAFEVDDGPVKALRGTRVVDTIS